MIKSWLIIVREWEKFAMKKYSVFLFTELYENGIAKKCFIQLLYRISDWNAGEIHKITIAPRIEWIL